MTTLARIDEALRRPDLTVLDLGRLLVARKRAFERLTNTPARTVEQGPFLSRSPEGPEGDE